jgi:hypothetical protein
MGFHEILHDGWMWGVLLARISGGQPRSLLSNQSSTAVVADAAAAAIAAAVAAVVAAAVVAVAAVVAAVAAAVALGGPCTESAGLTPGTDARRSSISLLMFVLADPPGGRRSRRRR